MKETAAKQNADGTFADGCGRRPAPQRGSASSERWLRWLEMASNVLVNAPGCRYKNFLLAMLAKLGQVKQSARMLYAHEIGASDDTRLVVIFSRQ
jgi:hypothetical protein